MLCLRFSFAALAIIKNNPYLCGCYVQHVYSYHSRGIGAPMLCDMGKFHTVGRSKYNLDASGLSFLFEIQIISTKIEINYL